MHTKIIKVDLQEQFRSCPTCGYLDGFHSMFKREAERIKWLFICPACHDTFDLGLTATENSKTHSEE